MMDHTYNIQKFYHCSTGPPSLMVKYWHREIIPKGYIALQILQSLHAIMAPVSHIISSFHVYVLQSPVTVPWPSCSKLCFMVFEIT